MELGIYTFGDITPDPNAFRAISVAQRYAEFLAAAKLADDAGLGVFGVGEHHRLDVAISSPAAVMAAIAAGTKRIRLTSAVTVLPTLDPVRVFQDFATVDLSRVAVPRSLPAAALSPNPSRSSALTFRTMMPSLLKSSICS